jgi:hypothetical protein
VQRPWEFQIEGLKVIHFCVCVLLVIIFFSTVIGYETWFALSSIHAVFHAFCWKAFEQTVLLVSFMQIKISHYVFLG